MNHPTIVQQLAQQRIDAFYREADGPARRLAAQGQAPRARRPS